MRKSARFAMTLTMLWASPSAASPIPPVRNTLESPVARSKPPIAQAGPEGRKGERLIVILQSVEERNHPELASEVTASSMATSTICGNSTPTSPRS